MTKKIFFILGLTLLSVIRLDGSCSKSCSESNFSIDWLYWNTNKCGLDYLWPADITRFDMTCEDDNLANTPGDVITPDKIDGAVLTLGKGRPKDIEPEYSSGFRIAWNKSCSDWYAGIRYTYYRQDESSSFKVGEIPYTPSRMHPDIKGFVDRTNITSASSSFDLNLDEVDIQAGKTWDNKCYAVTFFGGVKGGFICQEINTKYRGLSVITSEENGGYTRNPPDDRIHTVKEKVDMNAYGLFIGTEAEYQLCGKIGLIGRVSTGILNGHFDRKFIEKEFTDPDNPEPLFPEKLLVNVKDDFWSLVNYYEMAAGISYEMCNGSCADWTIHLGYEFHQWGNMCGFMQFLDHHEKGIINRSTESLGFNGLFLRVFATY